MPVKELPGIVLAPYGTLFPPALATYDHIKKAYEHAFPGSAVRLAFTSFLMKKRLQEKEGISVQSLAHVLEEMYDQGFEGVVIQSLQIVPGREFHQVAAMVQEWKGRKPAFSCLEVGLPLLSNLSDCQKVSSLLPALISGSSYRRDANEDKEAVLLVGHGTGHPADALYCLMSMVLKKEHKNVFLGTMEGFSGLPWIMAELKSSGARVVRLMPFLLVAGGHAENDIFGQSPQSWKSSLQRVGYEVVVDFCGLGERAEIVSLFLEHTGDALKRMEKQ